MNETEKQFHDGAVEMGYKVIRNGFPDFVLVNPHDPKDLIFVEVKGRSTVFTESQQRMIESLRTAGHNVIVSYNGVLKDVPQVKVPNKRVPNETPLVKVPDSHKCECGADAIPFKTWTLGTRTRGWRFRCTNGHEFNAFGNNVYSALTIDESIKDLKTQVNKVTIEACRLKRIKELKLRFSEHEITETEIKELKELIKLSACWHEEYLRARTIIAT